MSESLRMLLHVRYQGYEVFLRKDEIAPGAKV
jgi:hypothetical protein